MLVEMELREIVRAMEGGGAIFVLGEKGGMSREFPIEVDTFQASALELAINDIRAPRPLTHDLVLNVVEGMGGVLKRVIVDKLENNTFYGKLDIQQKDHSTAWIDVRPSDALVVASKVSAPIFVDEEVLNLVCQSMPPDASFPPDESDQD